MQKKKHYDLVVLGGGPAETSIATCYNCFTNSKQDFKLLLHNNPKISSQVMKEIIKKLL